MAVHRRPIRFLGSSLKNLREFPEPARQDAGYQLDRIQLGFDPDDWKPMRTIGPGVREIRVRDASGAYRILYVAKVSTEVCVLHCFQKKTRKTRKADIELAQKRYRQIAQEMTK